MPISNTMEAILKGVAVNEILWEQATRGPLAGAWLPVDVIDRPMWRFGWSATDRSLHVITNPGRTAPVPAPPMKFQVLSYGTRDNPWGRALLDRLYWVWYLKRHAAKCWSVFVERFAQPLVKGTYPFKPDQDLVNKEQEDRLLAILDTIRNGSSIALPEGLDVTFLEASRGGDASYQSFLSWLERAEALLMLGEVDTSGLAKGAGLLRQGPDLERSPSRDSPSRRPSARLLRDRHPHPLARPLQLTAPTPPSPNPSTTPPTPETATSACRASPTP